MKQTYKTLTVLIVSLMFGSYGANAQNNAYAVFMGTYNLSLHKGDSSVIMYDYIKLKQNNGKFECYRAYRFKDPQDGSTSDEIKQYYEIVNLDTQSKTITIKMGTQKATYKFKQNNSGGYDLVVYDNVLIYTSKK